MQESKPFQEVHQLCPVRLGPAQGVSLGTASSALFWGGTFTFFLGQFPLKPPQPIKKLRLGTPLRK